jgi:hypothetical protein
MPVVDDPSSARRAADDEDSAASEGSLSPAEWGKDVEGGLRLGPVGGGDVKVGDFGEGGNSEGSSGRSESGELTAGNEAISVVGLEGCGPARGENLILIKRDRKVSAHLYRAQDLSPLAGAAL